MKRAYSHSVSLFISLLPQVAIESAIHRYGSADNKHKTAGIYKSSPFDGCSDSTHLEQSITSTPDRKPQSMSSSRVKLLVPPLARSISLPASAAGRGCPSGMEAQSTCSSAFARASDPPCAPRSLFTPDLVTQGCGEPYVNWHEDPVSPRTEKRSTGVTRRDDVREDRKDGTHVRPRHRCPASRRLPSEMRQHHEREWCRSVRAQHVLEALCGVWDRRMRAKNVCGPEQCRTRRELLLAMRHIAGYVAWYQDEERRGAWRSV